MFEFKLQIGCILVSLFFLFSYLANMIKNKKIRLNPYFLTLLIISPISVAFDGITAWTVNNRDIVYDWVNLLLHCLFFVTMLINSMLIFLYMYDILVGLNRKKILSTISFTTVFIVLMACFIPQLYYIDGNLTSYSMGISVYIAFGIVLLMFISIIFIMLLYRKTISKNKKRSIYIYIAISLLIFIIQIIFPEILISSLLPIVAIVFIYVDFENPSFVRLKQYNDDIVTCFSVLVETRDNSTGGHIIRTKDYIKVMLNEMKKDPKYYGILSRDYIQRVIEAAPMHDIGKISTPDYILQKPGKLTEEEFEIMKKHSSVGGEIINETFSVLDDDEYKKIAYEVARFHHEKWNGMGYPDGIKALEIPLHARVMSIVDVFDAISSKRCYRDAMPLDKCFKIIEEGSGTLFDPDLVDIFFKSKDKIIGCYYKNYSKK